VYFFILWQSLKSYYHVKIKIKIFLEDHAAETQHRRIPSAGTAADSELQPIV